MGHPAPMLAAAPHVAPPQFFQAAIQVELAVFIALAFQVRVYDVMDQELDRISRTALGVALVAATAISLAVIYAALHALEHGGSGVTREVVRAGLPLSVSLLVMQLLTPFLLRGPRPSRWQWATYTFLLIATCTAGPFALA